MLGNNNTATNAPVYDAAGNPVAPHGHHNSTSTGGGIASKIPGTAAHDATHGHHNTTTGPGYGNTTTTHGSGGGIASKIPGTQAHEVSHGHGATGAGYGTATGPTTTGAGYGTTTGAGYGSTGTVAPDSHVGGHHNTTHSSHSTGPSAATKIESKIPGTDAHKATHPPHHDTTHTAGTGHVGGTHAGTTHGTHHDHNTTHGHHAGTTGTTTTKPSVADKIGGKIDVIQGEIKQTEGKAGLANAGLAGSNTTAAGGTHY
ncbi:hypothetical protein JCM11491_004860 [Sporobolomyces phaffii]